jgi:hypothetical protein
MTTARPTVKMVDWVYSVAKKLHQRRGHHTSPYCDRCWNDTRTVAENVAANWRHGGHLEPDFSQLTLDPATVRLITDHLVQDLAERDLVTLDLHVEPMD